MSDAGFSPDRLPPLNALRAFEAAARLLSFTKAADELNVTPGAISQQIRHLEEFAGAPLFRRTGRQVLLTETGQAALPLLTGAFDQMVEAAHLMRTPAKRNRLMVSCAPSLAAKWLAHRLDRFQSSFPEAEIWVSADAALADFAIPDIDLAIRYGPGGFDELKSDKLIDERVMPVCAPELLSGDKAIRSPADLALHTLLHDQGPEQDPSCPDWSEWLKSHNVKGVDGSRGLRFNQSAVVVEAAVAGRGVALAKAAIAKADLENGRLVAPFPDGTVELNYAYWVVWPKGRTQSPVARAFIKWLKDEAASDEVQGV